MDAQDKIPLKTRVLLSVEIYLTNYKDRYETDFVFPPSIAIYINGKND